MNTILPARVAHRTWDIMVIGAGVAGASVALQTSRLGFKTLLIEAKTFPREKVCGGCLNQRAQHSLQRLGLMNSVIALGAIRLRRLEIRIRRTAVQWEIPELVSIRRSTLDQELVRQAIKAGADFLAETSASVGRDDADRFVTSPVRHVSIRCGGQSHWLAAKLVIVADGLTRSSLRDMPEFQSHATMDSRIGVQTFLESGEWQAGPPKEILQMLVSDQGYVGLSPTDGGKLDLAAAIDPKAVQDAGGIPASIDRLLSRCLGIPVSLGKDRTWLATPRLTRSASRASGHRLLLIGDSIGYVEPFTGEGMSWALSSAEAVLPYIRSTIQSGWRPSTVDDWQNWIASQHLQKQRRCRWLAHYLRRPRMAECILRVCNALPPVRAALIRKTIS